MDSLNLCGTWLLDKKRRNPIEWDTFRLWVVIACTRQNRCDKSTAQRFWSAIVRAMGQKKRSKPTTSNSIDGFWKKSVQFFLFKISTFFFPIFWGSSYHEMIVGQGPKMVWGSKPYVNMTEHDRQNRALGFPARHNASQNKSLQNDTKSISDFWVPNGTPLQDAVHALLLQKLVHGSTVFAWIFHETGDGIKHVLTLLVVEW